MVAALDHFAKIGVKFHYSAPALESCRVEILEPRLWALHAIKHALRAVRKRHDRIFDPCKDLSGDHEVAREIAGIGLSIAGLPNDAGIVARKAIDADGPVRCADHAGA